MTCLALYKDDHIVHADFIYHAGNDSHAGHQGRGIQEDLFTNNELQSGLSSNTTHARYSEKYYASWLLHTIHIMKVKKDSPIWVLVYNSQI